MTNKEIIEKLEQIDKIQNFCDKLLELKVFEKEYKASDFYKITRIDLKELYKNYIIDQHYHMKNIFGQIQNGIDNLDLTKLDEAIQNFNLNQIEDMEELKQSLQTTFETVKSWGDK